MKLNDQMGTSAQNNRTLPHLRNLDLNKIAIFSQVVDSGNYRLASEVLNVTPSALSQSISLLEHAFGFPLFHRVGKKLIPTENGLSLHREFKTYHNALTQTVQKLTEDKDNVQGLIKVGAYLEFAKSQLAPLISQFLKRHPQAQVKMTFETPTRLQHLLERGQIDLCFSIYPSRQTRGIESQPVFKEELVLIAPRGLLGDSLSYEEVMSVPMIEYYFNHQPIRRWIFLHYKKKPQNLPISIYASTAEMVLSFVKEGAGIGVVPRYVLTAENSANIRIIRPTERKFADHIWMLEQKKSDQRAIHRVFVSHVEKFFQHGRVQSRSI